MRYQEKFPGGRVGVGLWLLLWFLALPIGAAASDARGGAWGALEVLGLGSIQNLAYSPDGTRLAAASSLGLVIWNEAAEQVETVQYTDRSLQKVTTLS